MATSELSKIYQMLNALSQEDQQKIAAYIHNNISQDEAQITQSETWEDGELEALLFIDPNRKPLTGKEIYENGIASGAIGSWADQGIKDGAEWVNQQKANKDQLV